MAGAGVPRDPAAAEKLLLEAGERGEPHAPAALAELYGLFGATPEPERAAARLDRARARGDGVAEAVAGRFGRAGLDLAPARVPSRSYPRSVGPGPEQRC